MNDRATRPLLATMLALGLTAGLVVQSHGNARAREPGQMVVVKDADLRWGPAPDVFPAGAQSVVLHGNLQSNELYTVRLKAPDGYRVAPHTHPMDEHVTVLKGTLMLGMGERFDRSAAQALPAGSFFMMPKGHPHFVWTKGETILQVQGMGPFGLTYINPADDPRKQVAR